MGCWHGFWAWEGALDADACCAVFPPCLAGPLPLPPQSEKLITSALPRISPTLRTPKQSLSRRFALPRRDPLTPEQVDEIERLTVAGAFPANPLSPQDSALFWQQEAAGAVDGGSAAAGAAATAASSGGVEGAAGEADSAAGEPFQEVSPSDWAAMVGPGAGPEGAAGATSSFDDADSSLGLGAFGVEPGAAGSGAFGDGWGGEAAAGAGPGSGSSGGDAAARHKVWVLFGGEGPLCDLSLEGGLHAFLQLR